MYGSTPEHPDGENIFYYLTIYNEPYPQPAEPDNFPGGQAALEQGILRGLYEYAPAPALETNGNGDHPQAQILGSGVAVRGAPGPAAAGRRLGRGRVRVVGHLVDRAAAGRDGGRGVEPAASRRGAAGAVRDPGAGRPAGPGRGGQ